MHWEGRSGIRARLCGTAKRGGCFLSHFLFGVLWGFFRLLFGNDGNVSNRKLHNVVRGRKREQTETQRKPTTTTTTTTKTTKPTSRNNAGGELEASTRARPPPTTPRILRGSSFSDSVRCSRSLLLSASHHRQNANKNAQPGNQCSVILRR